ncbi:MAG: cytidylate kinase-like family protein [Desulfuromusa sp.]|nr:cytidylate kinase-like family protein [Desulfuromusa sp.]
MAPKSLWTPQQDAKLQAWHRMQQVVDQEKPAPCFTIAREFGCQAYPLAEELIKRLNARVAGEPWVIVGRQILDDVAEVSGYTVEQIEKSQDTPSSLKAIFSMFLDSSRAEETEVFAHMRSVIRSFARRGNCVLVGRGCVLAVQDLPNCINLRLVADSEFRIQKIMKIYNLSEKEAKAYIALHQQQRDDFIGRFASGNIADPLLYHLVVNNAHMDVVKIAELAEEYMIRYTD